MPDLLYLIDVYSLVFQVFHAIPEMSSPHGLPTNAVFGFTRDILNILKQKQPTHLICASDACGPQERELWFPEYKAQRSATPDELIPQFPMVAETIQAFGIPAIEFPGWEADDVIATIVKSAESRNMDVCIVSNDKDVRQLLSPRVKIYQVRKNQFLGESELFADWGVRPDQVIDFQALVGDAVDNVPGVPLVGPKKASALLQQFGTLEEVLANSDKAPGAKLRENLKTFADQARLSRQLVTLRRDLPLSVDWEAARVGRWNTQALEELFRRFGFRRFGDEVRALAVNAAPSPSQRSDVPRDLAPEIPRALRQQSRSLFAIEEAEASHSEPTLPAPLTTHAPESVATDPSIAPFQTERTVQSGLFVAPLSAGESVVAAAAVVLSPTAVSSPVPRALTYSIVDTPEKLRELVASLAGRRRFCLDLETTNIDPLRADIVGWAISWEPHAGFYIAVRGPAGAPVLDPDSVVTALRPILEDPLVEVTNQNIKYDMLVLRRAGISLATVGNDPMVQSYLLEAGARSHSLDELARRYLQHDMIPITDLIGTEKPQKRMDDVEIARVAQYAVEDAEVAWELGGLLSQKLQDAGLFDLYWNLERPLIPILAEMQANGIRVNVEQLHLQSRAVGERLGVIRQEIYQLAGREFNIDSPKQLQQVLFHELGLPVIRKIKTGASTDQDVLEQLALQHPLPSKLLEHRTLTKLKGTYLDALPEMVNPKTGKIHTSFNQVVAATGRLSSSEPNLQNIPIRTPEGQRVRAAFVPSHPDWRLLSADYSQIELRMLAHFSGDPVLLAAFRNGGDIHTAVAAEVFGVPAELVAPDQRRVAKAVNFGVIYGQSPFGLATSLGISKSDAAKFIDGYFARYAGIDQYLEKLLEEVARTGYATTILGRRREIVGIRPQPQPGRQRNLPERTAINTVIQGSAADLIKRAMLHVFARLQRERHPGKMLLQIHDELVLEAPIERIAELGHIVREEMEQALALDVPLRVDLSVGNDWLNVESIEDSP